MRSEEVDRATPLAKALEQLGLADAATTIEDEQLGIAGVVEVLKDVELTLASDKRALGGWGGGSCGEYTDRYYTSPYNAEKDAVSTRAEAPKSAPANEWMSD